SLRELNACHVNFQGDRLSKIGKLKNLAVLNICHSAVYEGTLHQLSGLKNLVSLTLDGCVQVTIEDLESIHDLPLRRLSLMGVRTKFDKQKLKKIFPNCQIYCRTMAL